ncbi:MAG: hypothetical protein M1828_007388 [Chrysothrix sp. TS-e1954]|nr:MAG: hypothetical protein M1828_007388 [Chrysothrix sp. TS-e1954]
MDVTKRAAAVYACFCMHLCSAAPAPAASDFDVFQYVDQLIGTNNMGNVFAGATLPYGMAKAVADCSGQNTGGFATDGSNITGFSHMHDSGTGGQPSLGNFPLWPQTSCPGDVLDNCLFRKEDRAVNYVNDSIDASPGYFALTLENKIRAEMTVSNHTALYHFTFPETTTDGSSVSPLMILDLTDLQDSRQNATVNVNPETGRITGNGTFLPSFGSGSYRLNFCVDFTGATVRDTGIYVNSRAGTQPKELFVTRGIDLFYIQAGGIVRFNNPEKNNTLSARVGVSFISVDQACQHAESEIPTYDFSAVRSAAESAWREKLGVVAIDAGGASEDLQKTFWSGLYRTMISPQDYTGENPLWESTEPYFDSFYCLWDEFRAQLPLLTIVDPANISRMVRSLISTYTHLGWMPDCRMSLDKGFTQGGSNADVVLVDAYVKNITGVDWQTAYEAVKADAEHEPLDWSVEGRGGMQSWQRLNYIPYLDYDYLGFGTNSRSISRTLEYAYNDFCIATLAKGLGYTSDAQKYLARSGDWLNLYKANQTSKLPNGTDTGFTGFFQPKYLNGTWGHQDPILCSPIDSFCSLTENPQETFEDSIWEYQFYVPQNMASLINLLGGPESFVDRLEYLHTADLLDIGNEPSFITVYQYHYAGRPALSSIRAHSYIPSAFNSTHGGLPGNDDSGAMGSFAFFSMSGLFPVPGQPVYLITPPFFRSVSFTNPLNGKVATIRISNDTYSPTYDAGNFIQSATFDGENYTKNWISHNLFINGGTLELVLGNKESSWGQGADNVPPSYPSSSVGNLTERGFEGGMDFGTSLDASMI